MSQITSEKLLIDFTYLAEQLHFHDDSTVKGKWAAWENLVEICRKIQKYRQVGIQYSKHDLHLTPVVLPDDHMTQGCDVSLLQSGCRDLENEDTIAEVLNLSDLAGMINHCADDSLRIHFLEHVFKQDTKEALSTQHFHDSLLTVMRQAYAESCANTYGSTPMVIALKARVT